MRSLEESRDDLRSFGYDTPDLTELVHRCAATAAIGSTICGWGPLAAKANRTAGGRIPNDWCGRPVLY